MKILLKVVFLILGLSSPVLSYDMESVRIERKEQGREPAAGREPAGKKSAAGKGRARKKSAVGTRLHKPAPQSKPKPKPTEERPIFDLLSGLTWAFYTLGIFLFTISCFVMFPVTPLAWAFWGLGVVFLVLAIVATFLLLGVRLMVAAQEGKASGKTKVAIWATLGLALFAGCLFLPLGFVVNTSLFFAGILFLCIFLVALLVVLLTLARIKKNQKG